MPTLSIQQLRRPCSSHQKSLPLASGVPSGRTPILFEANVFSNDVSTPLSGSPRNAAGTYSSLIPSRQLSQTKLLRAMSPLPPKMPRPVPTGTWNVGHTIVGSRFSIGVFLQ
jgi:hypothetical protein